VLRVYGLVEAGIGVWVLLFPLSFAGVQALSLALPAGGGSLSFAIDVGLAALLVLPPTLLMGGTIPLLTQGLSPTSPARHASTRGLCPQHGRRLWARSRRASCCPRSATATMLRWANVAVAPASPHRGSPVPGLGPAAPRAAARPGPVAIALLAGLR
jgi:hypothetical protein